LKIVVLLTGSVTLFKGACQYLPHFSVFSRGNKYKHLEEIKKEYGDGWVIITGATSGLGYNYAKTFSKLGYNVCLISRDESKLNSVSQELVRDYNINTKLVKYDFSLQSKESIERLRRELTSLDDIAVVINNVGVLNELDKKFEDVSLDNLLSMVNVNCTSILIMHHILMKKLKEQNHRSLIIDLSSLLGDVGYIHNFIVYQATKAFITRFSQKIKDQMEMENKIRRYPVYKIDVMILKPSHFVTGMNPNLNFFSEKAENIVFASLQNVLNKNFENHGTFKHEFFALLMKMMPVYYRDNYLAKNRYISGIKDVDSNNVDLSEFTNKKI
jgi:short-subunit dehydrogenase